jgi:hypothetical protein
LCWCFGVGGVCGVGIGCDGGGGSSVGSVGVDCGCGGKGGFGVGVGDCNGATVSVVSGSVDHGGGNIGDVGVYGDDICSVGGGVFGDDVCCVVGVGHDDDAGSDNDDYTSDITTIKSAKMYLIWFQPAPATNSLSERSSSIVPKSHNTFIPAQY